MGLWVLAIGLLALLGIWLALRYRNGYWKRCGIPYIPATVLVGNLMELCTFSKPMVDHLSDLYNDPCCKDSAVVGIHIFHKPALMVRDLNLVKAILLKDFQAFANR